MPGLPLEISGLRVAGDNGRVLLSVDALSLEPGTCLGVRGPSGAGKSTLLFALAGLANIQAGQVIWGGTDLARMGEEGRAAFRRTHLGFVFQDFLLFEELSAAANAALAGAYVTARAKSAIAARAEAMLGRLGLSGMTGRRVDSFSGGERQRVSVARALAHDPAVILADEPTASLDRAAADLLVDDLVRLARDEGKTLIAVSHDPAVHERMDRVIEMADGQVRGGPDV